MKKLDKIDLRILDLLQMDGRITNKELSAKLSLSTTPVFERVKKLKVKDCCSKTDFPEHQDNLPELPEVASAIATQTPASTRAGYRDEGS